MKTFRFSLVALVATTLFVACSNDEVVEPTNSETQAISFRMQGGTPESTLRATATTKLNVDAFVVYADNSVNSVGVNIFDGVTVARKAGSTIAYDYNPKRYYTVGAANAGFFAYSPVSAGKNISNIDDSDLLTGASFEYEVVVPNISGNISQEDLLVAGTDVTGTPLSGAVSFDFKHALSRIFVKATNGLTNDVVIKKLVLKNLYSKGEITGSHAAAWTWAWDNYDNRKDYEYIIAPTGVAVKKGVTTTLVTSMEQGMLVIPQQTSHDGDKIVTADEFALEVTYDVGNLIGEVTNVFLTPSFTFLYNTQYAITINFSGTDYIEINFDIDVLPFDNDIAAGYPL